MVESRPYIIEDKYILRTPTSPMNMVKKWSNEEIGELCLDPFISHAIYLSSPELHKELQKQILQGLINDKLKFSVLKFLLRMSNRCTPFGLFAGIALGRTAESTDITVSDKKDFCRKSRLDMNLLFSIVQTIEADPELRNVLLYFPNTSLYEIEKEYRYVEYNYINSIRHHFTVSIKGSEYIDQVLKLAEDGASIATLVNSICNNNISKKEAESFILELITNQVLVSGISPAVSGRDYLQDIIEKTNLDWLKKLDEIIKELDEHPTSNCLEGFEKIKYILNIKNIPFNEKFLFQTDVLVSTESNKLDKRILQNIEESLQILNKLRVRSKSPVLENFKKAFFERYEEEEIPLPLALDVEVGIGYNQDFKDSYDPSPLIDDLILLERSQTDERTINNLEGYLSKKLENQFSEKNFQIFLKDEDMKDLNDNWMDVPHTFPVIASIFKDNNNEDIIYLSHVGGPTSNFLLGRFSHLSEPINKLLTEITNRERNQNNTVLAEIVHLPESRTGNILYRSQLRDYEIPYLSQSSFSSKNQIPITDLTISVKNDKLVLRSKKLNKVIEPRMANAHCYWDENNLPIYQFLADMQSQGLCKYLDFKWSAVQKKRTYLPRVMYKNIIFSRAEWRFKDLNFKNAQAIKEWQEQNEIPNSFFIADEDNELLIDLSHPNSCLMFLREIRNKTSIVLKENLYNEFESVVGRDKEKFANEFMFFVHKKNYTK